jgi:hypothetical protein
MTKTLHDLLSPDALLVAINSMAKERRDLAKRLDAGEVDDDDWEEQTDLAERLTVALNEFGSIYEKLREGEGALPSLEKILAAYE